MEKCKKMFSLFNKRIKLLYQNGYTKYQILNELKDFYNLQDKDISTIDNSNNIFDKQSKLQLDRKIGQHFSKVIYVNEAFDDKFIEINEICNKVKFDKLLEFQILDEMLDNPRLSFTKDITLSSAISIYEKPFNGKPISKKNYLDLIAEIGKDCKNSKEENNFDDNLLLFENAFKYLDYSIIEIKNRIEIYQELTLLLDKIAQIYDFSDDVLIKYFNLFSVNFLKDLIQISDYNYIHEVMRTIYSNVSYNTFINILPIFLENFPLESINDIINCFYQDVFINSSEKFSAILNIIISNSGNKSLFLENLNSRDLISDFEKDLSTLEFSINFEDINSINYYFEKIKLDKEYNLYYDILEDLRIIVKNFDRIERLQKKINNINENNYKELLIEVEQLNYFNRKVYSCCLNRVCYNFLDKKEFNFYYLLLLINLDLKEKATIYFYNNIKYINYEKADELFIYANMFFVLNYFNFACEILINLEKYIKLNKSNKTLSLYSYIIIELDLINELFISISNNKKIDEILNEIDMKEII
ncbi:MAG: hypothetical protein ACPKM0_04985 [Pleomorphochaeta sp.]